MKQRHIKGSVGHGGPHCSCCGGAANTRKVFRAARRQADREAIEEAIAEMHEEECSDDYADHYTPGPLGYPDQENHFWDGYPDEEDDFFWGADDIPY